MMVLRVKLIVPQYVHVHLHLRKVFLCDDYQLFL